MSSNIQTTTNIDYKEDLTVDISINYTGEPADGFPNIIGIGITQNIINNIDEGHLYAVIQNTNINLQIDNGNLLIMTPTDEANNYSVNQNEGHLLYAKN